MEHFAPGDRAADHIRHIQRSCPLCHGTLIRTPRRPVDRLRSLFTPVQRFRCERFTCQWVGNIRVDRTEV